MCWRRRRGRAWIDVSAQGRTVMTHEQQHDDAVHAWRHRRLAEIARQRVGQPSVSDDSPERRNAQELYEALRPRTEEEKRLYARVRRFGDKLVASKGLWHTTHPERFRAILVSGAILPEPPIPEKERWYSGEGVERGPFVRKIGGISLFDFRDWSSWADFKSLYPSCSLEYFVPVHRAWGKAVWIEIDRAAIAAALISPARVLEMRGEEHRRNMLMPGVEAAHIGPIPRHSFRRAFHVDRDEGMVRRSTI